jgi:hypothetical protein
MKRLAKLGKALPLGVALGGAACGANTDPAPAIIFNASCDMPVPAGQTCFDMLADFETSFRVTPGHVWDPNANWSADADISPTAKSKAQPVSAPIDPPRGASTHAFYLAEDGSHTQWGTVWLVLLDSKRAVDLSAYTGLSFWARSDGPPIPIKVAVADYGSFPDPGPTATDDPKTFKPLCDMTDNSVGGLGCYDDYSVKVYPDSVWRRYDIPFSSLTTGGWGLLHSFDPRRTYALKFSVLPEVKYSEWMDDIGFYLRK